jgi:hypothetical protein
MIKCACSPTEVEPFRLRRCSGTFPHPREGSFPAASTINNLEICLRKIEFEKVVLLIIFLYLLRRYKSVIGILSKAIQVSQFTKLSLHKSTDEKPVGLVARPRTIHASWGQKITR